MTFTAAAPTVTGAAIIEISDETLMDAELQITLGLTALPKERQLS